MWAAGLCFEAYGLQLGIRVNVDDPAIMGEIPALLPPGSSLRSATQVDALYSLIVGRGAREGEFGGVRNTRYYHLLYLNAARAARTMDWDEVRERLMLGARMLVAYHARRELFLAAGVVAYRDRAIVIAGLSQIARADLVTALIRAGCTYLSSEYAPVTKDLGLVLPFPNLLPMRDEPGERARLRPVEALGGVAEARMLPIGLVVIADHRPSARWRQREVSEGRAVLALMNCAPLARSNPQIALRTLAQAASGATTLAVTLGDMDEAAHRLLNHPMWRSSVASDGMALTLASGSNHSPTVSAPRREIPR